MISSSTNVALLSYFVFSAWINGKIEFLTMRVSQRVGLIYSRTRLENTYWLAII
jgi:hypothetical protein